jgi:hypothetical protein
MAKTEKIEAQAQVDASGNLKSPSFSVQYVAREPQTGSHRHNYVVIAIEAAAKETNFVP